MDVLVVLLQRTMVQIYVEIVVKGVEICHSGRSPVKTGLGKKIPWQETQRNKTGN